MAVTLPRFTYYCIRLLAAWTVGVNASNPSLPDVEPKPPCHHPVRLVMAMAIPEPSELRATRAIPSRQCRVGPEDDGRDWTRPWCFWVAASRPQAGFLSPALCSTTATAHPSCLTPPLEETWST